MHAQTLPDSAFLNLMLVETHSAMGPLVLATSFGIGFRNDCRSDTRWCENLALRGQIAWPAWRGRLGALSPFAGGELAWAGTDEPSRRLRGGPSLGVDLALGPLQPQHGPFPVSYPRSPLGELHISAGLVLWFGGDLPQTGQPGLTFTFSHTFGR